MLKFLSYLTPLAAIALIVYSLNAPKSQVSALPTCDVKKGSVYDGDTLRVLCNGQEIKIRFSCVDAPELRQEQGIASRDHLRSLLNQAGNRVKVRAVDTDRFGRTVADLYTDSGLVQLQQTKAGWVWANARYKSDCSQWNAIAAAEKEARAARRGIWAGNPMPPWEWRSHHLQTQSLQLLASGQKEEMETAIALITTEINQQFAAIQTYKYKLIFDPTESRAVMLEALTQAQERVIIVSPWLRKPVLDELRAPLEAALKRGVQIDIGFAHEGNIGFVLTESPLGLCYQQNWDRQKNFLRPSRLVEAAKAICQAHLETLGDS